MEMDNLFRLRDEYLMKLRSAPDYEAMKKSCVYPTDIQVELVSIFSKIVMDNYVINIPEDRKPLKTVDNSGYDLLMIEIVHRLSNEAVMFIAGFMMKVRDLIENTIVISEQHNIDYRHVQETIRFFTLCEKGDFWKRVLEEFKQRVVAVAQSYPNSYEGFEIQGDLELFTPDFWQYHYLQTKCFSYAYWTIHGIKA